MVVGISDFLVNRKLPLPLFSTLKKYKDEIWTENIDSSSPDSPMKFLLCLKFDKVKKLSQISEFSGLPQRTCEFFEFIPDSRSCVAGCVHNTVYTIIMFGQSTVEGRNFR